jgi:hypothetical protein
VRGKFRTWSFPSRLKGTVVSAHGVHLLLLLEGIQTAAKAQRISAGMDFEPVFFMMEARWFSTVR